MRAVPNDILAVLRRAGLLDFATEPTGEPLTGGVSSDIWRVDCRRPGLRQAGAGEAARCAADWRAPVERNRYEARWMRERHAAVPGAAPDAARPGRGAGALVMGTCRPSATRCGRRSCATARPIPPFAASVGARARAGSMPRPPPTRTIAAPLPDRRDLPRHPAGALPARDGARAHPDARAGARPRWSRPTQRPTSARWCTATSARRTSCSGPTGPVFLDAECAWWGDPAFDLAFCLNHLLLKCLWTPPRGAGFLACFDALAASLSRRRRLGAADASWRRGRRALLPGAVPRPRRRQVAGRVHRPTRARHGTGCGAIARALLAAPRRRRLDADARGLGRGAGRMTDTDDRRRCTAAASGTAAAGRRSRPRSCSRAAPSAARSRRRAPRPAPARRSTCATAAPRFGGYDVTRAVGARERRDRRARSPACDAADQAALDARPDRARRHAEQVAARRQRDARGVDGRRARRRRGRRRCRCGAISAGATPQLLPLPEIQIFGGGAHAGRRVDIQDFLVVCPAARELRAGAGLDGRGLPRRRAC